MIRVVNLAAGPSQGVIGGRFLWVDEQTPAIRIDISYPKRDVKHPSTIFQQWIGETKLFEGLDGLGLHAVCLSGGRFVGAIIENDDGNSESYQVCP